ncbi:MAG: hypothetical protein AAGC46_05520 [Solirubrobacteraceae bacterium]|nr:hypothetical protein [Patulibacter sp.]
MPRSPSEGAATRGPGDLDVTPESPLRDRRARVSTDRRTENLGPPNGIERRRYERRSHDRRSSPTRDRRSRNRRSSIGRRGTNPQARPAPRPRRELAEPLPGRSTTAKVLRAVVLTAIAIGCLLAATLSNSDKAGASAQAVPAALVQTASTSSPTIPSAPPAGGDEAAPLA